ncbi:MAG: HDIG domain-containing protein [Phycisphaerales bacterium]|nr:MAG: HDIG domain-containing protein [Phycisphaerales bacterium]
MRHRAVCPGSVSRYCVRFPWRVSDRLTAAQGGETALMSRSNYKSRATGPKSGRRREELRRILPKSGVSLSAILARPELLKSVLLLMVLFIAASVIVCWGRDQIYVRDGQIMTETQLKRVDYRVEDKTATRARREEASRAAPRIYRLNESYLERLEVAITGLPRALEGVEAIEEISEELIREFQLTEESLPAIQEFITDGEPSEAWKRYTTRLIDEQLRRRPLLSSQEFQVYTTTLNRALVLPDGTVISPLRAEPIELRSEMRSDSITRIRELILAAGFPESVVPYVKARLLSDPQPTFQHDSAETERRAEMAAAEVEPVMVAHEAGEVLYRRGEMLSAGTYENVIIESQEFAANASLMDRWMPRVGIAGMLAILCIFLAGYIILAYPRITRNALRLSAMVAMLAGMLVLSILVASQVPPVLYAAAIGSTLFAVIVLQLAYDQRLALFLAAIQGAFVTLALNQGVAWFLLLVAGAGVMILQLRDVRHRNSLIRAAGVTAVVLSIGAVLVGLYEYPLVAGATQQIIWNAVWAGGAAFAVGFVVLGILPSIEKMFGITTGMTLAELRDPKQPLLRQLQQTAPGTYNHSLQVANIAEAAADAIGADGLLVYVGALYHDVGKMNKPDYFVENQSSGVNKHDKLSPAMSLLVIVGHVKDGVELAREYGLPRSLIHFIEAHHGTTLVEYFYHAAKTQASKKSAVTEVEFRYPGPKPRTKEAAIMMLSDAVESATRAMAEPNPARIESLVRELSHKRLMDGQFDHSDLTFRELTLIEDAIISRLCAIHHSRISYPSSKSSSEPEPAPTPKPATASA